MVHAISSRLFLRRRYNDCAAGLFGATFPDNLCPARFGFGAVGRIGRFVSRGNRVTARGVHDARLRASSTVSGLAQSRWAAEKGTLGEKVS